MKTLENLKQFILTDSEVKSLMGSAAVGGSPSGEAQQYYCWTSGDFTYYSDTDDTGQPSESGQPINCSPVAVVSASPIAP